MHEILLTICAYVFLMKMNNFCSSSKVPAIILQCNIPSSADNFEESSEQELFFCLHSSILILTLSN